MSEDAIQEVFVVIESMEATIQKQNDLIARLINENVEQENFINEVLKKDFI